MDKIKLAIIGATGLVGKTFLHILEENKEEYEIKLFASEKSHGKKMRFNQKTYVVHKLNENSFDDVDYALFFSTSFVSEQFIPIALSKNVKVIDNSSFFRRNKDVKLIAYGANEKLISKTDRLISNPNCAVIQSIVILNALKELEISRISYNTYQSVSGSGKKGIDDLLRCRKGEVPLFYETDISFTCIPKIGEINENGISDEEDKLMFETKKILNNYSIDVLATCVRVPVMFSHGVSVEVKFNKEFSIENVIELLKSHKDIVICNNVIPTSILSCKSDKIYVGRIRKIADKLLFYCVADNVRVGAATNAYYILKHMIKIGD